MSKESERAKELATAHWFEYVLPTIQVHTPQDRTFTRAEVMEIAEHHYLSAATHFYGHAIEDQRSGFFAPSPNKDGAE